MFKNICNFAFILVWPNDLVLCCSHRSNVVSDQDSEAYSGYMLDLLDRLEQSIMHANDLQKWVLA